MTMALEKMNREQLREVWAKASALLGVQGSKTPTTDAKGSERPRDFYDEMKRLLEADGVFCPPFPVFAKSRNFVAFKAGVDVLYAYVDKYFKPKKRLERSRIHKVLLGLIVTHMRAEGRVPVSVNTVARRLVAVGGLVDMEFPGYRESNMLPIMLSGRLH
jgi:hypothetical protein